MIPQVLPTGTSTEPTFEQQSVKVPAQAALRRMVSVQTGIHDRNGFLLRWPPVAWQALLIGKA